MGCKPLQTESFYPQHSVTIHSMQHRTGWKISDASRRFMRRLTDNTPLPLLCHRHDAMAVSRPKGLSPAAVRQGPMMSCTPVSPYEDIRGFNFLTKHSSTGFKGSCAAKASPMKSPSCQYHNEIVGKQVLPYDSVVLVVGQPDNQPNYEWLTNPMTEAHLDFDCSEDFVTFIGDNVAQARVRCGTNQVLKKLLKFLPACVCVCAHVNLNSVLMYSSTFSPL